MTDPLVALREAHRIEFAIRRVELDHVALHPSGGTDPYLDALRDLRAALDSIEGGSREDRWEVDDLAAILGGA